MDAPGMSGAIPPLPTGCHDLDVPCLMKVLEHLDARDLVRAACVHPLWRALASDEALWRTHLERDYATTSTRMPDGTSEPSCRDAYGAWHTRYVDVPQPLLQRASRALGILRAWLEEHLPGAAGSLRPGASADEVARAGEELGAPLPPALAALYRLCDGQSLAYDAQYDEAFRRDGGINPEAGLADSAAASKYWGCFGGYSFYRHVVCVRMMPLARCLFWTQLLRREGMLPSTMPHLLLFGASFSFNKVLLVDCDTGQLYITAPKRAAARHGNFAMPGAPSDAEPGAHDGVLRWFEAFVQRLAAGVFRTTDLDPELAGKGQSVGLCLFPASGEPAAEAITAGVRVCAAPLLIPEYSHSRQLTFAYCIRFSLLPEGGEPDAASVGSGHEGIGSSRQEQGPSNGAGAAQLATGIGCAGPAGAAVGSPQGQGGCKSCQLISRHWIIRDAGGMVVDNVVGEGVVGRYPLLVPGAPEFVYASCTQQTEDGGSMEGTFTFVQGSILQPSGPEFSVACPRFELRKPDYIF